MFAVTYILNGRGIQKTPVWDMDIVAKPKHLIGNTVGNKRNWAKNQKRDIKLRKFR